MELLDTLNATVKAIHDYFGYREDWVVLPIEDRREMFWWMNEDEGIVRYHDDKDVLLNSYGDYFEDNIYTQRFLPKWVYARDDYTMVCVDTRVDGNRFLAIFTNANRVEQRPKDY